jgi:hypothetical protein
MFELGRLLAEQNPDDQRARNLWKLALSNWRKQEQGKAKPDLIGLERIVMNLAKLEERAGNLPEAIQYLETAAAVAPDPAHIKSKIEELKKVESGK